ncbi:MAG TPA: hypothetical protein VJR25_05280 [Microbacterium sp.]|nr:hypothetical protein [Microbacterium sp.]
MHAAVRCVIALGALTGTPLLRIHIALPLGVAAVVSLGAAILGHLGAHEESNRSRMAGGR